MGAYSLKVWMFICGMLTMGSSSTLTSKGTSQFFISPCENCAPIKFNHPYVQTLFMFFGEFACLGLYFLITFVNKKRNIAPQRLKEGKVFYKFWPHVFLFIVPTICDITASTLYNVGLYYSIASVHQILRNVRIVFVAIFSLCFWKDFRLSFDLPQVFGLTVLFIGATIVALSAIIFTSTDSSAVNPVLGVVLTLLGCVFAAMFVCSQELFLRRIQTTGLMGVGNEGGWGILLYAILLPIFNTVTNPFSDAVPKQVFDNIPQWAYQMKQSAPEVVLYIAYALSSLGLNCLGMEVTNHVSASSRSTFDACRSVIIWAVSLIVGWETWETKKQLIQIVGFLLITTGVLIYNNVVRIIPFLRHSNKLLWAKTKHSEKIENSSNDITVQQDVELMEVFRDKYVEL